MAAGPGRPPRRRPRTRPPRDPHSEDPDRLYRHRLPNAAQALQIRRRRRRLDQPKRFTTETVYAITDLQVHQAKPVQLAAWIRGHWSIENSIHWARDVTYDEDRSQIRTGTGPQVMAALRNAAIAALHAAETTNIAAANRYHARDSSRPLALLGLI
ncbi:transposase [Krasilnikovia sp. MM14-A1259]|uniref:transposase n=1 Tax=Krasilnikovia sp. MM14-A1259 TaxID=3373539 RepID=UPI0038067ACC